MVNRYRLGRRWSGLFQGTTWVSAQRDWRKWQKKKNLSYDNQWSG